MSSPFVQPDYTTHSGSQYPTNIDNAVAVLARGGAAFSPEAQATPNMTILLNAGHIFDGVTLTEVAAQNTGTITAPVTDPRIDRVVIDSVTGAVSVVTGAEGAVPAAPAIPAGKLPVAQIALATSTTAITYNLITDERSLNRAGALTAKQTGLASATTTDLGSAKASNILITGTTTITGFGSSAAVNNPIYFIEFDGALTLTHNGTSLKLPGSANITTAAGDTAIAEYLGSGNWRVRDYAKADGRAVISADIATQAQAEAETSGKLLDGANAKYHPGIAKAWAYFNGSGTPAFNASYGLSSITDNGLGTWNLNLTTNMSSANYCVGSDGSNLADPVGSSNFATMAGNQAVGSFKVVLRTISGAVTYSDGVNLNAWAWGDL